MLEFSLSSLGRPQEQSGQEQLPNVFDRGLLDAGLELVGHFTKLLVGGKTGLDDGRGRGWI